MKIKKAFQGALPDNKIVNTHSNSQTDTYSCDYLNNNFGELSFCKMSTNDYQSFTTNREQVTVWGSGFEYGDYEYDTTNNRLVVTNTTLCEISGAFGGGNGGWAIIEVNDGTSNIESLGSLIQSSGNGYFFSQIQTSVIELDPTKTYYIYMTCCAYTTNSFTLNAGFGTSATWISAKKVL